MILKALDEICLKITCRTSNPLNSKRTKKPSCMHLSNTYCISFNISVFVVVTLALIAEGRLYGIKIYGGQQPPRENPHTNRPRAEDTHRSLTELPCRCAVDKLDPEHHRSAAARSAIAEHLVTEHTSPNVNGLLAGGALPR